MIPTEQGRLARLRPRPFWNHKRVSYLKSAARIIACFVAAATPGRAGLVLLAFGLFAAEWIGVWEELGGRGE